jgi:hypothetical protein
MDINIWINIAVGTGLVSSFFFFFFFPSLFSEDHSVFIPYPRQGHDGLEIFTDREITLAANEKEKEKKKRGGVVVRIRQVTMGERERETFLAVRFPQGTIVLSHISS